MSVLCLARARSSLAREAHAEAGRGGPSIPSHGRTRCRKTVGAGRHSVSTAYLRPSEPRWHARSIEAQRPEVLNLRGLQAVHFSRRSAHPKSSASASSATLARRDFDTLPHALCCRLAPVFQSLCYRYFTFHRALWLTQPGVWPPGIWAVPPCNASTARPEVSLWAGCSET